MFAYIFLFSIVMGCAGTHQSSSFYESMLNKVVLYTKAKYKTLETGMDKQQIIIDSVALDELGLFISGPLNRGNRVLLIEKQPINGREIPVFSPLSLGHYKQLIYQFFGWPITNAVIDLSFHQNVSQQLLISLIYALNTVEIARSLNFTNQIINDEVSSLLAAWMANSVNLQFISLVNCQIMQKNLSDIAEALLRMARKREKLSQINRCEEISVNEQEAFLYEVPKVLPVHQGLLGFDISRNNIGDNGCMRVFDALEFHTELQYIGLAECGFGMFATKAFCELSTKFQELRYLDLSNNPDLNDKCLELMIKAMEQNNFKLSHLIISNCKVTRKMERKLLRVLTRNLAVAQAYEDIFTGVMTRVLNTGEMAGDCHGKGSDSYVEYFVTSLFPDDLNTVEHTIFNKLFEEITIQEGFVKPICQALAQNKPPKRVVALEDFTISVSETIGKRPEMEDVVAVHSDFIDYRTKRAGITLKTDQHFEVLMCLFDGHGGVDTAQSLGNLFPAIFADTLNGLLAASGKQFAYELPDELWEAVMYSCFARCDDTLRLRNTGAGSTGQVILVMDGHLVSANAGDTRAIVVREEGSARLLGDEEPMISQISGRIFQPKDDEEKKKDKKDNQGMNLCQTQVDPIIYEMDFDHYFENTNQVNPTNLSLNPDDIVFRLSFDHKPELPEEKRRIESVGGYVHAGRVMSTLAVARGFGDFSYKPSTCDCPFVNVYQLQKHDAWIILGCDGVWDVLQDIDAALIVHRCMTAGVAAIRIRDESFRLDSTDNISSIAMRLFFKEEK